MSLLFFLSVATLAMNVTGLFGAKLMFMKNTFPFPATLPFLTSLVIFLVLLFYPKLSSSVAGTAPGVVNVRTCPKFWMYMFFFGTCVGLSTGFSALSIASQDISMKEIIEASQPIFTMITFIFYEKQKVSRIQFIGILLTVVGVLCSVVETPDIHINGLVFSMIIVISNAFVSSLSSRIKIIFPSVDNFSLMIYSSVFVIFTTFFIALQEGRPFSEYVATHSFETLQFVFLSGFVAILYQYLNLEMINRSSSLFSSMVYSLKIIMVITFSIFYFEDSMPRVEKWIGMLITMFGFGIYSYSFLNDKK